MTKTVSITAATLSGNQGAASMLISTIDQLKSINPSIHIYVFSYYPNEDATLNSWENVEIVSGKPLYFALKLIPLSCLHRWLPFVRRSLMGSSKGLQAIVSSDLVIDLAGISFADGRTKFLLYNIATLLPAIYLKVPVVKFAQAMGPFKSKVNKSISGLFLKRLNHIFARGAQTRTSLNRLNLGNVDDASDIAFLFQPNEDSVKNVDVFCQKNQLKNQEFFIVAPSAVLYKKAEKQGIDYIGAMAKYVDWLGKKYKQRVVLVAHSLRPAQTKLHNNDLPICQMIYEQLENPTNCLQGNQPLYAGELKTLISRSRMVAAARFHAMVSSLSSATPVVVSGWSHKYQEVLDQFELKLPVNYLDTNLLESLKQTTLAIIKEEATIRTQLTKRLPIVKNQAKMQVDYVRKFVA